MDRSNGYEAAFEAYLQCHRLCYVAVDETRRSFLGESSVKNLDFIVYGGEGVRLLVDIKGRRFPYGPPEKPRRVWECWASRDDLDGLERWQTVFGPAFVSLLVFVYAVDESAVPTELDADLWVWRGQRYLLRAVRVADYRERLRVRSPKWDTVTLAGADYR